MGRINHENKTRENVVTAKILCTCMPSCMLEVCARELDCSRNTVCLELLLASDGEQPPTLLSGISLMIARGIN